MSRRAATWFTSDTHFRHARIIELARRPFADVREMDEALVRNWNEVVRPGDVVWHVGDFAFGPDDGGIDAIFARLMGTKHLVVGNHDEGKAEVLTLPWASVSHRAVVVVDCQVVVLDHYPMRSWPRARKGALHFYGHMHGKLPPNDRSLDVGVDAWNFRPVSLADVRRRMRASPPDPTFAVGGARR